MDPATGRLLPDHLLRLHSRRTFRMTCVQNVRLDPRPTAPRHQQAERRACYPATAARTSSAAATSSPSSRSTSAAVTAASGSSPWT